MTLDPLSALFGRFLGMCLYYARRYEEAVVQLCETLEVDPTNVSVHELLSEIYLQTGRPVEALNSRHRVARILWDDDATAFISSVSQNAVGAEQAAKWIAARQLEQLTKQTAAGRYVPSIYYARQYIAVGDIERSFAWLERSLGEYNVFPLLISSDPYYDPIRGDNRFQKLVERVGNPPA